MILVTGIRVPIDAPEGEAFAQALRILNVPQSQVAEQHAVKVSIDARRRYSISLVYSVGFLLAPGCDEAAAVHNAGQACVTLRAQELLPLTHGTQPMEHRPVIAGFGPAGMFAALLLAREGYRPIVLERGGDVDERVQAVEGFWHGGVLDGETNVQFGEGGAGTFSDGKLTTRIGDPRCERVLQELVKFGAPREILYRAKPHIGTDLLRGIVKALRQEILALGGEVRFHARLEELTAGPGGLASVRAGGAELPASALVLAVGHSARDVFELLVRRGVALQSKPFSVGVRIEHLQSEIDRGLFGEHAGHPALGHGEYQLSHRKGERAVYTFCMCPGGTVVPSASEQGGLVVNGMSEYARDGANANSALVVSVDASDFGSDPLDGVAFQRKLEQAAFAAGGGDWRAPVQSVGAFMQGRAGFVPGGVEPSYALGAREAELSALFPPQVTSMLRLGLVNFNAKLPGFGAAGAVLTGVETRTSSPVRVPRGEDGQAVELPGLYPCGEGAGYAGGIMSAAVDGLRIAESIIARWAPVKGE